MTWETIQRMTNRALHMTIDYYKLLLMFSALVCVGLMVVACKALALNSGAWAAISLQFLPVYVGTAVLMSAGIVLARVYHDEVRDREVDYKKILLGSWQVMLAAAYFTIPIILVFLVFWMALGFFYLVSQIPLIGQVLAVVLAFWPFLLNFAILLLVVASVIELFFVTPVLALKGIDHLKVLQALKVRFVTDPFGQIMLLLLGMLPLIIVTSLLVLAGCLTCAMGFGSTHPFQAILQIFFVMVPVAAMLTPAMIFFFNLAVEAHVLSQSRLREQ
ncbi:MAG: hypothetical protein Q8K75_01565 [Chlamydiales bacterium]|nr:hypothetical protein [Chlamydiales bacterium]